jgi:hypothetical protein
VGTRRSNATSSKLPSSGITSMKRTCLDAHTRDPRGRRLMVILSPDHHGVGLIGARPAASATPRSPSITDQVAHRVICRKRSASRVSIETLIRLRPPVPAVPGREEENTVRGHRDIGNGVGSRRSRARGPAGFSAMSARHP